MNSSNFVIARFLMLIALVLSPLAARAAVFTWTGTSAQLDLDTNWSPGGGPPSSFSFGDAVFDASAPTKTGLTPNGGFSVVNATFTAATYSFAAAAGGDLIGIDGGLTISSAASVNFSDQSINVGTSMNWAVNGNSAITGSGLVTASDLALGINFGASQINIVRLGSLALGPTGTLVINNWGGTLGVYGGTNNQLRFTTDPTAFLSKISFTGYSGTVATQNQGGDFEVIAVPEPKTWLMLALGLTVIVVFRRRQKA